MEKHSLTLKLLLVFQHLDAVKMFCMEEHTHSLTLLLVFQHVDVVKMFCMEHRGSQSLTLLLVFQHLDVVKMFCMEHKGSQSLTLLLVFQHLDVVKMFCMEHKGSQSLTLLLVFQHLDVVKMFCMEKHKGSFRQTWHGEYYNPLLHLACKVGALSIIRSVGKRTVTFARLEKDIEFYWLKRPRQTSMAAIGSKHCDNDWLIHSRNWFDGTVSKIID